jgi:hypothetical protein
MSQQPDGRADPPTHPSFPTGGWFGTLFVLSLLAFPVFFVWRWLGADLPGWFLWADLGVSALLGVLALVEWLVVGRDPDKRK